MPFAVTQNSHAVGRKPMPTVAGSYLVPVRCTAIINGTGAVNDVVPLAKIPAGAVVVDWMLDNDDLDTGGAPSLAFDLGVIVAGAVSAAAANGGKWLTASTAGQAAAATFRHAGTAAVVTALARMSPDVAERSVGLVLTAVGNGAATANSVVGLTLIYRASYQGN